MYCILGREMGETMKHINGPKVAELERKIAKLQKCKHAIGVSSGTDALLASLMALGIGPGDEVITTPFTFVATAEVIARVGAKPVFVDIDPLTYNIDAGKIAAAITNRTRAIIPVHLFGQMADMDPIVDMADQYELLVIEDACQAIGSSYKGQMAGSFGITGCFSFFPSKNLGGIGDSGMITTNSERIYGVLRAVCNHGRDSQSRCIYSGGNFRMDEVQAEALLEMLSALQQQINMRTLNAMHYDTVFEHYVDPKCYMAYHQYVIRIRDRDRFPQYRVYYHTPLHLEPCFEYLGHKEGDFPEAEKAAREVLALPIEPSVTVAEMNRIIDEIQNN